MKEKMKTGVKGFNLETSIVSSDSSSAVKALNVLLADSYIIAIKTQFYHWNVQGIAFHSLHLLFESQYKEMYEAIDEIAEEIRALGSKITMDFNEYLKMTSLKFCTNCKTEQEMIGNLLSDHEKICESLRNEIEKHSENAAVADLMTQRLREHLKTAWMLRSSLS